MGIRKRRAANVPYFSGSWRSLSQHRGGKRGKEGEGKEKEKGKKISSIPRTDRTLAILVKF